MRRDVDEVDHWERRSLDLREQLSTYVHRGSLRAAFDEAWGRRFSPKDLVTEQEAGEFYESFVLKTRLSDGRTPLERFVRARGDLPREERDVMLRWLDYRESVFEVRAVEGMMVDAVSLIDDLEYAIHASGDPQTVATLEPGTFLIARILPLRDTWIFNGWLAMLPPQDVAEAERRAVEFAREEPARVFKNPERLETAWTLQREERTRFIDHFGSDAVILPLEDVISRLDEFWEIAHPETPSQDWKATVPSATQTVGVFHDETEGLTLLSDYDAFLGMFREEGSWPARWTAVHQCLRDSSFSPLAFRYAAQLAPDDVDRTFARGLHKPRFTWEKDGERLLRTHKPWWYEQKHYPMFLPLGDRLTERIRLDNAVC
jgi:hypothetical protein